MNAPRSGEAVSPAGSFAHEKTLNQFEDAWQSGTPPRLETFCPPAAVTGNNPAQLTLLRELLKIDLEYRWKCAGAGYRAERLPLEEYGARYPQSAACVPLWLEMIGEDYRAAPLG